MIRHSNLHASGCVVVTLLSQLDLSGDTIVPRFTVRREGAEPGAMASVELVHRASISVVIVLWYNEGVPCWFFPQASINDYS